MARHLERFGIDAILVTEPGVTGDRLMSAMAGVPGVIEAVAGACSVLLRFETWHAARAAVSVIEARPLPAVRASRGPSIEIPIRYDGIDLEAIATERGLSCEHVIALHRSTDFTVAFCGFAPGFAYLTGLPPELHVPRLAAPRAQVPAGAVAIADAYCGIYPRSTPGGWRIIGSTDLVLFDEGRDPPALLSPGMRVHFVPRPA